MDRVQVVEALREENRELQIKLAQLRRRLDVPNDLVDYKASFDKAAAGLVHYGPDGRFRRVNECFCRTVGYRPEELLQLTIQQITHPNDVQPNTELDVKLLAGAISEYAADKRLLCKDERPIWVRMAVSLHRDAEGMPLFFVGVVEDITARKEVEQTLYETQMRLAMAAEIAEVGYSEFDLVNGMAYFSPEWKRLLGYEDAGFRNDFSEWTTRLHPEDRDRIMGAIERFVREPDGTLDLEYRLRHRDGRYRWCHGRVIAVREAPGRVRKLLGVHIDITERKLAEAKLREQSEELRLALRVGRSGAFQWDAVTHEHRWGDEMLALYGLSRTEFAATDEAWLACLLPEDRAVAMEAVEEALKTGDYAVEFRIRRRSDGQVRWISARGKVFSDAAGVPSHIVGINVDMTEQRVVQSELEESNVRQKAVLDSLNEGVVIFDLNGRVLSANPAALASMRCKTAEEAQRSLPELAESFEVRSLDGRPLPLDEWPIARVLRGESFSDYEVIVYRKADGGSEVISYNGAPVRNAAGDMILGVLTLQDVSDRKWAERALQESERRLGLALKAGNSAVWEVDVATGRVLRVDDFLYAMLGYEPGELSHVDDWISRIHEEDRAGVIRLIDEVIQGQRENYYGVEVRYHCKDGSWRWILCQVVAAGRDAQGRATHLVGTHTDINARKLAEERIREAALHDPLTGLPNRALVFEYCNHHLAAARRSHEHGALLFIDLDRFKPINDQHGHEVGDLVLQEAARRLQACTRGEDLVGRLGGDEFVIVLAHRDAGRHRAAVVAQHVIDNISRPFRIHALELSVSPSIGISFYPEHAADVSSLIHAADVAMYQAKQSGRGSYQFYTPELDRQAESARHLETALRNALRHGGLALHYQPVVDIRNGRPAGAEALVRLTGADGKLESPKSFLSIAESTGLITELGEWVVGEACRQQRAWSSEDMHLAIAINVSPLEFRQRNFAERLRRILSNSGVDPACLQLEVTESTVMENLDEAVAILNNIKSLGMKVALDDVGTGYSSLSSLSRLPLDKLKVDQSFVRRIESDRASRAVTEAIIALGRTLKLDVIGEGIESRHTLDYLEEHGCNQAQGFLFSRPLPAAEFAGWYRRHMQ
jgi:diguanylate cyclase (GGDEF)-like protein/PAS domain S-box-containing protein